MRKNNLYTFIFLVVGGLLIFVVGFYSNQVIKNAQTAGGVNITLKNLIQNKLKTAINKNGKAILSFSPLSGEQKIGKSFNVSVVLNSQEQNNYGADVIINYDPLILELMPVEKMEPTDCVGQSDCLEQGARIINKWQDGEIIFSYLAPAGTNWQGETKIVELNFTPKKAGAAYLKFNFEPNSSTDCNVAGDNGQDILNKVNDAQFIIK